ARRDRGLGAHLLQVANHRRPLPVDQHRDQQHEREALPPPEPEREYGSEQQRSHPRDVPAHRAVDEESPGERDAVRGDPIAEQALPDGSATKTASATRMAGSKLEKSKGSVPPSGNAAETSSATPTAATASSRPF